MAKKKRSDEYPSSQEPASSAPKKPTILGTDHALTVPTTQGTSLDLSYWDLWFSIVAVHDARWRPGPTGESDQGGERFSLRPKVS